MFELPDFIKHIKEELSRDGFGSDITTQLIISDKRRSCTAVIYSREDGIFCGERVIDAFQKILDREINFKTLFKDGDDFPKKSALVELKGRASLMFSIERTLLNYLAHLCGVATLTRKFVRATSPFQSKIMTTRKTLPHLRDLQIYAVTAGGGHAHRTSLNEGILIKDNHLTFVDLQDVVKRVKRVRSQGKRVEIEIQSLSQLGELLTNCPDVIMLDNFSMEDLKTAVVNIAGRCEIEVSGGVNLEKVRNIAELGVHYISVGRLTHSAPSVNLTMEFS